MHIVIVTRLKLLQDTAIQQFTLIVFDACYIYTNSISTRTRTLTFCADADDDDAAVALLLTYTRISHIQLPASPLSSISHSQLLILHEQNEYKLNTLHILDR